MVETQNLWPHFKAHTIPSPKKIMMEQAEFLKEKTNGRLYAQIVDDNKKYYDEHTHNTNSIKLLFQIIAPALGNYRYTLFTANHGITPYPVSVNYGFEEFNADNIEELVKVLSKIFNSEDTIKKISTLLSYE